LFYLQKKAVEVIIIPLLGNTSEAKESNLTQITRINRAMAEMAGANIPSPKWSLV